MEIVKLPWDSPDVREYLLAEKPVVLLGCPLAIPAANRWTTEFLSTIVIPEFKCSVFESQSMRFQYFDDKNNKGYSFEPPTAKIDISFVDFAERVRQTEENVDKKYYYLQVRCQHMLNTKIIIIRSFQPANGGS